MAHTPANQQKQKANQILSLPCSEPSEIPVSLKARARVFPETYRPCMIWPSCLLPSPPSALPLFIQCQPHWPPCYSKNYQTRSCPRALALTVSPAWNSLPPQISTWLLPSSFRSLLKCHLLRGAPPDHPARTTLGSLDPLSFYLIFSIALTTL